MVEIKTKSGKIFGVPHHSNELVLSGDDVAYAASALSGLATKLALVGGGLAFAALAINALASPGKGQKRYSWRQIAEVKTRNRKFSGVCLEETIQVRVEGHSLEIPVDYITDYSHLGDKRYVRVNLVDGSQYWGNISSHTEFRFLTPLGVQTIDLGDKHSVAGMTFESAAKVKQAIGEFLEVNAMPIEKILGKEAFEQYFIPSAS